MGVQKHVAEDVSPQSPFDLESITMDDIRIGWPVVGGVLAETPVSD